MSAGGEADPSVPLIPPATDGWWRPSSPRRGMRLRLSVLGHLGRAVARRPALRRRRGHRRAHRHHARRRHGGRGPAAPLRPLDGGRRGRARHAGFAAAAAFATAGWVPWLVACAPSARGGRQPLPGRGPDADRAARRPDPQGCADLAVPRLRVRGLRRPVRHGRRRAIHLRHGAAGAAAGSPPGLPACGSCRPPAGSASDGSYFSGDFRARCGPRGRTRTSRAAAPGADERPVSSPPRRDAWWAKKVSLPVRAAQTARAHGVLRRSPDPRGCLSPVRSTG